ncbi:MAG: glycogen synthase GlgA [Verrucomicrobiota bacterium]
MNILYTASEMSPLAKTGGLGDVMQALPAAMRRQGHSVSVAIPLYKQVRQQLVNLQATGIYFDIHLDNELHRADVMAGKSREGVTIFAIENDYYFNRPALYGEEKDYYDNGARFIFFSRAVVELASWLDPLPDIIHANDWQVGMVPGLVRAQGLPFRTVFTIHNLAYQGIFPLQTFSLSNLPGAYCSPVAYEHFGQFNMMKGALALADQITTVSPSYAQDIQTGEFGCGLDGLLQENQYKLTGIVNGIDTDIWNPKTDPHLAVNYDRKSLKKKDQAKAALQAECGWDHDVSSPLFGSVSRLADQKGLDMVAKVLPRLIEQGGRFILLGSGDPALEHAFKDLAWRYPEQVFAHIGFDEGLAHRIEAGADFFLMPSRFEPCGLNQMYSQRYGTIPIVHAVGGLRDTVKPWEVVQRKKGLPASWGTGFAFYGADSRYLMDTIDYALRTRAVKTHWKQIRQNAMHEDFSWDNVLSEYQELYKRALA